MILVEKFIPKIWNFGHDIDAQNEDQDNNNRHKDNHVKDDHHKDDQDKGNHDKYNLFCIKKMCLRFDFAFELNHMYLCFHAL